MQHTSRTIFHTLNVKKQNLHSTFKGKFCDYNQLSWIQKWNNTVLKQEVYQ
jgi:hypothetical protein